MFLELGTTKEGEWVHIANAKSGKTDLLCPYCRGPLIAKKGKVLVHHFAHNGDTCQASTEAVKHTQIPTIDHFDLLDPYEREYLNRRQQYGKNVYWFEGKEQAIASLGAAGILEVESSPDYFMEDIRHTLEVLDPELLNDQGYPSDRLIAIDNLLRKLRLGRSKSYIDDNDLKRVFDKHHGIITKINRSYHTNQLDKQNDLKQLCKAQRYWFDAFCRRQNFLHNDVTELLIERIRNIAKRHLYVFRFQVHGFPPMTVKEEICRNHYKDVEKPFPDTIYKVGVTTRDNASERVKEVTTMLRQYGTVQGGDIVGFVQNAGHMERLIHHRHQDLKLSIGNHQEFFHPDIEDQLSIIKQMDALAKAKYPPYDPPSAVIPEKPLHQAPVHHSSKTVSMLLTEYQDVVTLLKQNLPLKQICRETGRALNTVKKVRKAMGETL